MKPYQSPYLIQRIERAQHDDRVLVGLSAAYQDNKPRAPAERAYINGLMPLDYMGSSEFEFGAFGEAMDIIRANRADYFCFEIDVTGTPDNSWHKDFPVKETTVRLYGFAHKDHLTPLEADIKAFVADKFAGRTKERVKLQDVFGEIASVHYDLNGRRLNDPVVSLKQSDLAAWFDLDNAWMVGSDKSQMDRIAELLGIA